MSFARSFFLNRIGGQIAILILMSLIAIHVVIIVSLFIGRDGQLQGPPGEAAAQFVAAVKLVAAAAPAERARSLAQIAKAFPDLQMTAAATMPEAKDSASAFAHDERQLRFLGQALGPGFEVVALPSGQDRIAVRLPDAGMLTANLSAHGEPPMLGGPLAITLMFIVVSVTLLALWASRALRAPLSGFAEAAENFSLNDKVAALPERGPEEIRAVAKAFNRMSDRIRTLVDDRTRMLAAMGHDLRTPITRLRLRSEFIGDAELRREMLRDLDQMGRMTESVVSFLRDGRNRAAATYVDVATGLQTICDQFADLGYRVDYIGPSHLAIMVCADELHRAVSNMVDNAVRHGKVTLVRLAATSASVTIDVEDDGPGIVDAQKAAVIEPFIRGEQARTMNEASGFGLGLTIARAVAEAHDGTLTLHDRAPHGLVARITLPGWAATHPRALTAPRPSLH